MDEERSVLPETDADDWDDVDFSDVDGIGDGGTADDQAEADQPEDGSKQEEEPVEPTETKPEKQPEADLSFKLKYFGEEKEVSREEAITLAQKGMDYDRIRKEYDEFKPKIARYDEYEKFLNVLAAETKTDIPGFMDSAKARILAAKEGIDESAALERVKLENKSAELDKREAELSKKQSEEDQKQAEKSKRDKDISEFMSEYGNSVDIKSIPSEVWHDVSNGKTLLSAYQKYENKKLKADLEALKKENTNKERTTGSRATVGAEKADKWFDGWSDD